MALYRGTDYDYLIADQDTLQQLTQDAQDAAASAETSFDNLQGFYYGEDTSDPTEDPNGDPPDTGDLYFNSNDTKLKVYDGTNWVDATSGIPTVREWVDSDQTVGGDSANYSSGTVFIIPDEDVASTYHVGRRCKADGTNTGTIYGTITAVDYNSTNANDTTVTVSWDSGSLSNESLTVWVGIISAGGEDTSLPTGTGSEDVPTNADLRDGVERRDNVTMLVGYEIPIEGSVAKGDDVVILICAQGGEYQSFSGILSLVGNTGGGDTHTMSGTLVAHAGTDTGGTYIGWSAYGVTSFDKSITAEPVECTYNGNDWVGIRFSGVPSDTVFTGEFNPFLTGTFEAFGDGGFTPLVVRLADVTGVTEKLDRRHFGRAGDIVESGTNSNGSYVRWENGEQVAWVNDADPDTTQITNSFSYPAAFNATPAASFGVDSVDGTDFRDNVAPNAFVEPISGSWRLWLPTQESTDSNSKFCFFAWGFWK